MNMDKSKRRRSKKFPSNPKITSQEIITDQSDPRMVKFRKEHSEFELGYPRKTVKLQITEYEGGSDEFNIEEVIGYYEGEPPPEYTASLRELLGKALLKAREAKEREKWSQELQINIRDYSRKDRKAVLQLWKECKLTHPWEEPVKDINRRMKISSDLFLVGVIDNTIVATVMGRCDEDRGWTEYLAVDPSSRRKGIGRQLLKIIEERLYEKGCTKIGLFLEQEDAFSTGFYRRVGYRLRNVTFAEKRLTDD